MIARGSHSHAASHIIGRTDNVHIVQGFGRSRQNGVSGAGAQFCAFFQQLQ
jgi:hypothetical protein